MENIRFFVGGIGLMRRGFGSRLVLCLVLFAVAFGVTFGVLCLGDRTDAEAAEVPVYETPAADVPVVSEALSEPMPEATVPVETETTTEAETQTTPESTPEPEPQGDPLAPPYHEEQAPDDYFQDALFIGNSLIEGLGLYACLYDENIDQAKFDTATSMTILGAGSYFEDAASGGYGKIYIGLGLNEIGYDREAIRQKNVEAVDTIRAGNPDAIIYFFSLTPISKHRSESDSLYNNENAAKISEVIRSVAEEKGCYYIDMVPVLAGEDGYLPSDVTGDGIHCVKEYYPKWYDYLEHNYVLP